MGLLRAIQKDLRLRLADPMSLALWIGIPVIIGGLISLAFGGGGTSSVPKAKLLLADQDDTFWTRNLAKAADGVPIVDVVRVNAEEGRRRIDTGDGSAFLVIPKGASQTIIDGKPLALTLITNPSQRILPRFIEDGLEMLAEVEFYIQRGFGDLIREITRQPAGGRNMPTLLEFLAVSRSMHKVMESAEEMLFPPVLSVEPEEPAKTVATTTTTKKASRGFSFGLMMFPGIIFMALLFMSQGMSLGIWSEREEGTLRRLMCTPHGPATFLLSKVCAGTLLMTVVISAALALGWLMFGLPVSALPLAALWCTFAGACILTLFCVLQMLASSLRGAEVLTTMVVFPMMMLGGAFVPFETMPKWMVGLGQTLPNGLALVQLKTILQGEVETQALATATLWLAGMGIVLFFVADRLIRSRSVKA